MKRLSKVLLFAAFAAFMSVPQNVFAQSVDNSQIEEDDDYDSNEDFYEDEEERLTPNGAGDQFITIALMPTFPLGFGEQLYPGGALSIGYHRFLTDLIAVGADIAFGYHPTIGSNIYTYIPFTVGITFQPYVWRFEFPITLNVGMAIENYLQYNYFPGLIVRGQAGCYYRMNESWSFGAECQVLWMPQWYKNYETENFVGISATLGARYHF
mgnify:CR=1 FL=1